jgi:spore coat protein U-like protein
MTAASYFIVFTRGRVSSGSGESLTYGLYPTSITTTALCIDGNPTNADQVISLTLQEGVASATVNYYLRVSNSTFPSAGTYAIPLTARLYTGSFSGDLPSSSKKATMTAMITVGKIADVAVVGGASDSFNFISPTANPDYTLSLGSLSSTTATTGTAYILVRTNSSYSLALSSASGGRLVDSSDSSSTIPYTVNVDSGSSRSLSTSAVGIVTGSATYSNADRHTIVVTVGGIGSSPSPGTYTDTITVTVAAS